MVIKANIYQIKKPDRGVRKDKATVPLLFSSPHSGREYPEDFGYGCDLFDLRRTEDNYVDELFSGAPDKGAYYLGALFPKTYIDPNRALDEIDPHLLCGESKFEFESESGFGLGGQSGPGPRAMAGIGLFHRLVRRHISIYSRHLSDAEITRRIDTYYTPYHAQMSDILDGLYNQYDRVWHVDCHSMPSGSLSSSKASTLLPDFVIGDLDGTSCAAEFSDVIRRVLVDKGYKVAMNVPYKGAYILENYGRPAQGRHSLQLEINKALYIDEYSLYKKPGFVDLQSDMADLMNAIIHHVHHQIR